MQYHFVKFTAIHQDFSCWVLSSPAQLSFVCQLLFLSVVHIIWLNHHHHHGLNRWYIKLSGHLTQLLWASSEAVGCAIANVWIPNKPGYIGEGMTSSYTVCHYSPQGNVIGHEKENWKPKREGKDEFYNEFVKTINSDLCSTYNPLTGDAKCGEAGSCMGLSNEAQCGCGYAQGKKVPRCSGHCIVQCWNVWGSRNFWPQECMGENLCTCGRQGAICS